ncbi:hypothetical protein D6817_03275 [Candidatus Pacearchaeota archaeon]|nr:MAG: hypothetical protein D6817_03275 [Candidatus Pacearchaeota archaeon]
MGKRHTLADILRQKEAAEKAQKRLERELARLQRESIRASLGMAERLIKSVYASGNVDDIAAMEDLFSAVNELYETRGNLRSVRGATNYIRRGIERGIKKDNEREERGVYKVGREAAEYLRELDEKRGIEPVSPKGYYQRIQRAIAEGVVKPRVVSERRRELTPKQLEEIQEWWYGESSE